MSLDEVNERFWTLLRGKAWKRIGPGQVIAVGDGSAGSHFIEKVGLSIALRPEKMSIKTDGILSGEHISSMLCCLGIPKSELRRYLRKESP